MASARTGVSIAGGLLLLYGCSGDGAQTQVATSPQVTTTAPMGEVVPISCRSETERAVGDRRMLGLEGETNVVFQGSLSIDADGAPNAYHADGRGLDHLANAGRPGAWWGLVVDGHGNPVVQSANDPAPGYYVSRTSLEDRSRRESDPARYVDAAAIPYIVLPGGSENRRWLRERGLALGDLAVVYNRRTQRTVFAIWADNGPAAHLGEGSIALAEGLGYDNASPRNGGTDASENVYLILGGTSTGWPRTNRSIHAEAEQRFEAWGGTERLERCRSLR